MDLGNYRFYIIQESIYSTDAGSSHGPVPKILWKNYFEVYPDNTIDISTNLLLILGKLNILVDAGIGKEFLSDKQKQYLRLRQINSLTELISDYISLDKIDYVIFTHLHYDHVGSIIEKDKIIFPKAKFIIQEKEFKDAHSNHLRLKTAYPNKVFDKIPKDKLILINGDYNLSEDIKIINTPGHTPGHQSLLLTSNGKSLIYTGDLIPLKTHINPLWVSGYDLNPLDTVNSKLKLLEYAYKNKSLIVFSHDLDKFGFVDKDKNNRFVYKKV